MHNPVNDAEIRYRGVCGYPGVAAHHGQLLWYLLFFGKEANSLSWHGSGDATPTPV